MSGKRSRDKGKRGEREFANLVRPLWPDAKRGWQSRAGDEQCDVEGCGALWVEVKVGARPNIHGAVKQALKATDGRAIMVASKRDREDWLVTLHLHDFLELMGVRHVPQ